MTRPRKPQAASLPCSREIYDRIQEVRKALDEANKEPCKTCGHCSAGSPTTLKSAAELVLTMGLEKWDQSFKKTED